MGKQGDRGMTAIDLEEWLVAESAVAAQWIERETAVAASAVLDLEKRLQQLTASAPADCEARAAALMAENVRLDRSIAHLEDGAERVAAQLIAEVSYGLEALDDASVAGALKDAQELFDLYASDDLPGPIDALPPAMLEAVLSQSSLGGDLAAEMNAEVARCHRKLAEAGKMAPLTATAGPELEQVREEIRWATVRLEEHAVAPEVLRNLDRIEESEWLLEEVLDPYTAAAQAEAPWRLKRDVFKELGYAV
jgi:cell division protein FtsB